MSAGRAGAARQHTAAPPAPPGIAQPPPGIGISPIVDMEGRQTIAAAARASKSSAEMTEERWLSRHGISRSPVAPTTPATWLNACRTRRCGATRESSASSSRFSPLVVLRYDGWLLVVRWISTGHRTVVRRMRDQHRSAPPLRLAINFSHGAKGKAPISKYIVAIPVNGDAFRAAAHTIPACRHLESP